MNISSLNTMEQIVSSNNNLSWEGWDVVQLTYNPTAWKSPQGTFFKGKWYTKTVYALSENGWTLPSKFAR